MKSFSPDHIKNTAKETQIRFFLTVAFITAIGCGEKRILTSFLNLFSLFAIFLFSAWIKLFAQA